MRLIFLVSICLTVGASIAWSQTRSANSGLENQTTWTRPTHLDSILPYAAGSHHLPNKTGFRNNYIQLNKSLKEVASWNSKRKPPKAQAQASVAANHALLRTAAPQGRLTWFGQATFLLQLDSLNIITDPHFSNRASPVPWFGPKRITPLSFKPDSLPPIHLILISHNHYDHLDKATLENLIAHNQHMGASPPQIIVGLRLDQWFVRNGFPKPIALDWWQESAFGSSQSQLRITALPAQHWSKRAPLDNNRTLWCGYAIEWRGRRIYFAGDTGYGPDFVDIGRVYPTGFDLALIPIGAYDPRWFMQTQHVDPAQAVQIHREVGSRFSVGMHWGTFILTDEPLDEPPRLLAEALKVAGLADQSFMAPPQGQSLDLGWLPPETPVVTP